MSQLWCSVNWVSCLDFPELFLPRAQLQLSTVTLCPTSRKYQGCARSSPQVDLLSVVWFCLQTALILFAMKVSRSLLLGLLAPEVVSHANFSVASGGFAAADQESRRRLMSLLIDTFVTLYRYDCLFATLADTSTCSSLWVWGLDVFRDEAAALPAAVLHVFFLVASGM